MRSLTHPKQLEAESNDTFRDVVAGLESRAINKEQPASMEEKKAEGYF